MILNCFEKWIVKWKGNSIWILSHLIFIDRGRNRTDNFPLTRWITRCSKCHCDRFGLPVRYHLATLMLELVKETFILHSKLYSWFPQFLKYEITDYAVVSEIIVYSTSKHKRLGCIRGWVWINRGDKNVFRLDSLGFVKFSKLPLDITKMLNSTSGWKNALINSSFHPDWSLGWITVNVNEDETVIQSRS